MGWIDLEGAVNVRDLGGLPTADGGATVAGRLLRSENLQELSPADVARLVDEIGVTTVVDLRTTAEVELEGPGPLDAVPGVRHAYHPVLPELGSRTDAVAEALLLQKRERDKSRFPDDIMCGHYLGYLEERPGEVAGALRSIATSAGAAIVHCAAGKDRTGVLVAVLLSLLGIPDETVAEDYALSEKVMEEHLSRLVARLPEQEEAIRSAAPTMLSATPANIRALLDGMRSEHGSVEGYVAAHGAGPDVVAALRGSLLE